MWVACFEIRMWVGKVICHFQVFINQVTGNKLNNWKQLVKMFECPLCFFRVILYLKRKGSRLHCIHSFGHKTNFSTENEAKYFDKHYFSLDIAFFRQRNVWISSWPIRYLNKSYFLLIPFFFLDCYFYIEEKRVHRSIN